MESNLHQPFLPGGEGPFGPPVKCATPLPRAGFGPEVSVGLWTLMHRSTGTDTPLLLFLPSVPSGAAAETGPTKVVCERSCKIEGWRGKERRRDGRELLEAERGKREKKRSLVLVPSSHPLPSPPRGDKTSPALTAAPGGHSSAAPAMPWPPRRDGHHHKPVATDPADPCRSQAPSPAFQTQPVGMPAIANQPLQPRILILSAAKSIPVHPVASVAPSGGLRRGSLPPSNPPPRYLGYSELQLPKLIC